MADLLSQIINARGVDPTGAASQLAGAVIQRGQRTRAEQEKAALVEGRRQASVLGTILSTPPEQRAAVITEFAGRDPDAEFQEELTQFAQLDPASQDRFARQQLMAEGFESFIPQAPKQEFFEIGKEETLVDADGNIIFEGRTSAVGEGPLSQEDEQKQVNTLRKSLEGLGKDFRQVEQASNRVQKIGNNATPASDLALIFNYMKLLDPGSVVRESEFKTAEDAKAWLVKQEESGVTVPAPVSNFIRRASEGTLLEPAQRQDFLNQATDLFTAARETYDGTITGILDQAEQDQISPTRLLGRRSFEAFQERTGFGRTQPESVNTSELSDEELLQLARERGIN